ncbi:MAG: adenylate kinase [Candidatus Dormiibacterota bacterium]
MKAAVVHRVKPAIIVEERPSPAPLVVEAALSPHAPGLPNTGIRATEFDLPMERARPFVRGDSPRLNLLLLGAPASGKGTQADLLASRLDIPAIATGNILRAELAERTELGLRVQAYMQRGDLVPDALMIDIIRERLMGSDRRDGFLFDGFPRTVPQARALDALAASMATDFDRVLYLNVPEAELIRRVTTRLTCPGCGRSYGFEPDQPRPLSCVADGRELIVREDDRPETAQRRIAVYLEQTLPVLDHYRKQGLVAEIDGIGSVEEVSLRILRALPARPVQQRVLGLIGHSRRLTSAARALDGQTKPRR